MTVTAGRDFKNSRCCLSKDAVLASSRIVYFERLENCATGRNIAHHSEMSYAEFTHTMHLKMQDTLEQNDHSVSFWRFVSRLVWKMAKTTIAGPFAGAAQEQDARSAANLRMAIASTGRHLLVLLARKSTKEPSQT